MQRRTLHYRGHVQGVGFRATVQHLARGQPVTGYVRNLSDGSVELVIEGDAPELDRFAQRVADALADHIRDTSAATTAATGEFTGFAVRR